MSVEENLGMEIERNKHSENDDKQEVFSENVTLNLSLSDLECKYVKLNSSNEPPTVILLEHEILIVELITWILNKIQNEEQKHQQRCQRNKKYVEKVVLSAKGMVEITRLLLLADGLVSICSYFSSHPEVKSRIFETEVLTETCWPSRWFLDIRLNRPENNLTILDDIFSLPQIEELHIIQLDMESEHICCVDFSNLKHLRVLNLEYNNLNQLPPSIMQCTRLEVLRLCGNKFQTLPRFLLHLPSLNFVTRLYNSFDYQDMYTAQPYQSTKDCNVDSLRNIALRSVLQDLNKSEWSELHQILPKSLRKQAWDNVLGFCDICNHLVSVQKAYQLNHIMGDFFGNIHVPLTAYFCSEHCALKFDTKSVTNNNPLIASSVVLYDGDKLRNRRNRTLCPVCNAYCRNRTCVTRSKPCCSVM